MALTSFSKGDVIWVNFDSKPDSEQAGHEQRGYRPAVVITSRHYNDRSSLLVVCPITSNPIFWPWKVILPDDCVVKGAVLIDQIRTIDRTSRRLKPVGNVGEEVMQEVIIKLSLLISS